MIVGIDLGTSTSAIGYFAEIIGTDHGHVRLVQTGHGVSWMPSAVLYNPTDFQWIVGTGAQNMRRHPDRAPYYVNSAKRHLGISPNIDFNGSSVIVEESGRKVEVTPQLILSKVLSHLKQRTENLSPDHEIDEVVVAVPMVYMSHEASLTKEAVELAGLRLKDFIQEPTAAALCYVHENEDMNTIEAGEKILVFDLGGGTFDITVFQLANRHSDELELDVIATEGERNLGGDDVDTLIMEFLFENGLTLPAKSRPGMKEDLLAEIESSIKIPLSNTDDPGYQTTFIYVKNGVDFDREISRREFIDLLESSEFATRLRAACKRVFDKIGTVDRAMLVGGSSQLPICRTVILEQFGDRVKINSTVNVQEAVVRGAVYRAAHLSGRPTGHRKIMLRNSGVLSHDLGVLVGPPGEEKFKTFISKQTPYPMEKPVELSFKVRTDGDLIVECAQGDEGSPFSRGFSGHQVFGSVDHGKILSDTRITIRFQANHFGEIMYSSSWNGGELDPRPLRPGFKT